MTKSLARFQAVNDPSKPLINLSKGEQEEILVKLTTDIEAALNQTVPPKSTATAAKKQPNRRQPILDLGDESTSEKTTGEDSTINHHGVRVRSVFDRLFGEALIATDSDPQLLLLWKTGSPIYSSFSPDNPKIPFRRVRIGTTEGYIPTPEVSSGDMLPEYRRESHTIYVLRADQTIRNPDRRV